MNNKLQTVADAINSKLKDYFLACPGVNAITVIELGEPLIEYKVSYADNISEIGCSYENIDGKVNTTIHVNNRMLNAVSEPHTPLGKLMLLINRFCS